MLAAPDVLAVDDETRFFVLKTGSVTVAAVAIMVAVVVIVVVVVVVVIVCSVCVAVILAEDVCRLGVSVLGREEEEASVIVIVAVVLVVLLVAGAAAVSVPGVAVASVNVVDTAGFVEPTVLSTASEVATVSDAFGVPVVVGVLGDTDSTHIFASSSGIYPSGHTRTQRPCRTK